MNKVETNILELKTIIKGIEANTDLGDNEIEGTPFLT